MRASWIVPTLLLLWACKPPAESHPVAIGNGESRIFENSEVCHALAAGDLEVCKNPDCRGILGGNALACETGDCTAIIRGTPDQCTNQDCEALAQNHREASGELDFTGRPSDCASLSCKAVIRGLPSACPRRAR